MIWGQRMSPYEVFAAAAKGPPERSLLEVWIDFACWESARAFGDDPNPLSRAAIDWIRRLDELQCELKDFGDTEAVQACRHAAEATAAAFARIDHEPELCQAVRRWHRYRQEEAGDELVDTN